MSGSTRPRHRRKGLFRLAAGQAYDLTRELGAISVPVEVICGDHKAIALYRGLGFQTTRTLNRYTCFRS
ncbi:GNAT family N-acetyltransferase [Ciceribacter selenitireducens]